MSYDYRKFRFTDQSFMIVHTKEIYTKSASGKSWQKRAIERHVEPCEAKTFTNYVTSIPFFNNFGNGASCRATWSYSPAGYLPNKITTISPGANEKHIDTFEFSQRRSNYEET